MHLGPCCHKCSSLADRGHMQVFRFSVACLCVAPLLTLACKRAAGRKEKLRFLSNYSEFEKVPQFTSPDHEMQWLYRLHQRLDAVTSHLPKLVTKSEYPQVDRMADFKYPTQGKLIDVEVAFYIGQLMRKFYDRSENEDKGVASKEEARAVFYGEFLSLFKRAVDRFELLDPPMTPSESDASGSENEDEEDGEKVVRNGADRGKRRSIVVAGNSDEDKSKSEDCTGKSDADSEEALDGSETPAGSSNNPLTLKFRRQSNDGHYIKQRLVATSPPSPIEELFACLTEEELSLETHQEQLYTLMCELASEIVERGMDEFEWSPDGGLISDLNVHNLDLTRRRIASLASGKQNPPSTFYSSRNGFLWDVLLYFYQTSGWRKEETKLQLTRYILLSAQMAGRDIPERVLASLSQQLSSTPIPGSKKLAGAAALTRRGQNQACKEKTADAIELLSFVYFCVFGKVSIASQGCKLSALIVAVYNKVIDMAKKAQGTFRSTEVLPKVCCYEKTYQMTQGDLQRLADAEASDGGMPKVVCRSIGAVLNLEDKSSVPVIKKLAMLLWGLALLNKSPIFRPELIDVDPETFAPMERRV